MGEKDSDNSPRFDRRPWGTFTVLDEGDGFKVKRIEVLPGKRLSYQKHAQRAEHWVVVDKELPKSDAGRRRDNSGDGASDRHPYRFGAPGEKSRWGTTCFHRGAERQLSWRRRYCAFAG